MGYTKPICLNDLGKKGVSELARGSQPPRLRRPRMSDQMPSTSYCLRGTRRRRRRRRRTRRLPGPLGTRNGARPVRRSFVGLPPGAHEHPVPRDSTVAPLRRSLPRELHAARGRMASRGVNRVASSFPLPSSFSSRARTASPSSAASGRVLFLLF